MEPAIRVDKFVFDEIKKISDKTGYNHKQIVSYLLYKSLLEFRQNPPDRPLALSADDYRYLLYPGSVGLLDNIKNKTQ